MSLTEAYESLLPRVKPFFKKAIFLEKTKRETHSFLGGIPKVSKESFTYPYINYRPLSLIAQIDLAEINQNHIDYLPNEGILLFFYDVKKQVWGFNPKDKPHFKVIYLKDGEYIDEKSYSKSIKKNSLSKHSYIKANYIDVPIPVESEEIDRLKLTIFESDVYENYSAIEIFNHEPQHQLGGSPFPIQGNKMELEAQLVTHGIYCGNLTGYKSKEAKLLEKDANKWKLLLQVDSDEDLDLMWGDMGMLYFWVEESEAKCGNFENVWLILQC